MNDDHLQHIRAAKAGDKEAFTHLVRSYKDFLFRSAFAIVRDYGDAEDVVQDSFVKAFLSIHTLKDERAFASWISTITTRIALDIVRRKSKIGEYNDSSPNPETVATPSAKSDLKLDIEDALFQLSPEHRTVIALREVQGFDYQEIANILEIPIGTVRSRLSSARMQLRKRLYPDDEKGRSQ